MLLLTAKQLTCYWLLSCPWSKTNTKLKQKQSCKNETKTSRLDIFHFSKPRQRKVEIKTFKRTIRRKFICIHQHIYGYFIWLMSFYFANRPAACWVKCLCSGCPQLGQNTAPKTLKVTECWTHSWKRGKCGSITSDVTAVFNNNVTVASFSDIMRPYFSLIFGLLWCYSSVTVRAHEKLVDDLVWLRQATCRNAMAARVDSAVCFFLPCGTGGLYYTVKDGCIKDWQPPRLNTTQRDIMTTQVLKP